MPLIGGIAISVALGFGTTLVVPSKYWNPSILGMYLLVVIGTVDDRFDLPPNVRLIAQSCAAMLVVFASGITNTNSDARCSSNCRSAFVRAFSAAFHHDADQRVQLDGGIDGLAGGLALLSLVAMAIVGINTDVFGLIVLLIAVVLAFLIFNFPVRVVSRSARSWATPAVRFSAWRSLRSASGCPRVSSRGSRPS